MSGISPSKFHKHIWHDRHRSLFLNRRHEICWMRAIPGANPFLDQCRSNVFGQNPKAQIAIASAVSPFFSLRSGQGLATLTSCNDGENNIPRIFVCNGRPLHHTHTRSWISKCHFLTRNGLHENYRIDREIFNQNFYVMFLRGGQNHTRSLKSHSAQPPYQWHCLRRLCGIILRDVWAGDRSQIFGAVLPLGHPHQMPLLHIGTRWIDIDLKFSSHVQSTADLMRHQMPNLLENCGCGWGIPEFGAH